MAPSYVVGRDGDDIVLRTYDGKMWREHNPADETTPSLTEEVEQLLAPCCPDPS